MGSAMTEPLYNSSEVLQAVSREYPTGKAKRIAAAVDDYAQTPSGRSATRNLLLGGGEPVSRDTFEYLASEYVRTKLYGGVLGFAVWVLVKPLVLAIISSFVESLFMQEKD